MRVPHRPGLAPALGLRAAGGPRGAGPFARRRIMWFTSSLGPWWFGLSRGRQGWTRGRAPRKRRACRLRLEPLEDRLVLSGDVVLEWNGLLLDAARANSQGTQVIGRSLAILHTAIYDAVNAIDRSY